MIHAKGFFFWSGSEIPSNSMKNNIKDKTKDLKETFNSNIEK